MPGFILAAAATLFIMTKYIRETVIGKNLELISIFTDLCSECILTVITHNDHFYQLSNFTVKSWCYLFTITLVRDSGFHSDMGIAAGLDCIHTLPYRHDALDCKKLCYLCILGR